jgi:thioredoxin reductase (NADPH)
MASPKSRHAKLIIIGSGPAGYTAAIYAARAMVNPLLIEGVQPGGQMTITTDVENYPGFADVIQGPWLMEQMRAQAVHVGTEMLYDHIVAADISKRPFRIRGDSGTEYTADALIIATGAKARWLGLPSEHRFQGYGVSACATCDGFFFRGKEVTVVGGGNTAVEEALYLANIAKQVLLVHRRGALRSEKILQERLFANPKIDVMWNYELDEVLGTDDPLSVTGARLKSTLTSETVTLPVDGIFIAIGHEPQSELFKGQLEMKPSGYIVTAPRSTATSLPGVFAAGDVADDVYRQAVTAAGFGCMAALDAEKYLAGLDTLSEATSGEATLGETARGEAAE